eukprot:UN02840
MCKSLDTILPIFSGEKNVVVDDSFRVLSVLKILHVTIKAKLIQLTKDTPLTWFYTVLYITSSVLTSLMTLSWKMFRMRKERELIPSVKRPFILFVHNR